jgi:hypothetical protein
MNRLGRALYSAAGDSVVGQTKSTSRRRARTSIFGGAVDTSDNRDSAPAVCQGALFYKVTRSPAESVGCTAINTLTLRADQISRCWIAASHGPGHCAQCFPGIEFEPLQHRDQ